MDNGDILLIPYRTYYTVKKRIQKLCAEIVFQTWRKDNTGELHFT